MTDPIDIEAHKMCAVVLRDSDHPALIAEIERLRAVAERAKDVADETFGPFPVQNPEDALSAIEKGCFEARQEYERLRAENERMRVWVGMALSYCDQELKETEPKHAVYVAQRRIAAYIIHVLTAALEGGR